MPVATQADARFNADEMEALRAIAEATARRPNVALSWVCACAPDLTSAQVTAAVDRMASLGLVDEERHPLMRVLSRVALTPRGRRFVAQHG